MSGLPHGQADPGTKMPHVAHIGTDFARLPLRKKGDLIAADTGLLDRPFDRGNHLAGRHDGPAQFEQWWSACAPDEVVFALVVLAVFLIQRQADLLTARVSLYRAIGGSWADELPSPVKN